MRGKARLLALIGLLGILAVACSSAGAPSASIGREAGGAAPLPFAVTDAKGAPQTGGATTPQQGIPALVNPDRNLILTANVSMKSKDPWATADKVRAIVAGLRGDVLAMSQTGQGENRSALVSFRVPSISFDEAVAQLKLLDGEVSSSNVDAKDVTDQFSDLKARLVAKQAEEARYLQMVPQAKSVDEMLKIEGALSNVRTQIEQLQGQVNQIRNRTDYSTITLSISPIAPVTIDTAKGWDPASTFARAAAALTVFLRVLADIAIWLLVFGWMPVLALAILLGATRVRRTRVTTT